MSNILPTSDEFLAAYPQFSGNSYVQSVDSQLILSGRLLSRDAWGEFYSDAVMLDAAHNLLLSVLSQKQGGLGAMQMAAGSISSVSAAGVSTSFNSSQTIKSQTDEWYSKTIYGQQFLRLRHAAVPLGYLTA